MKIKLVSMLLLSASIFSCGNRIHEKNNVNIEIQSFYDSSKKELKYKIINIAQSLYFAEEYCWVTFYEDSIVLEPYAKGAEIDYNEFPIPKMKFIEKGGSVNGSVKSISIPHKKGFKFFINAFDMDFAVFIKENKIDPVSESDFDLFEQQHSVLIPCSFDFARF